MSDTEGLQFLQVTNNTESRVRARFHGIDYVFDIGEPVTIPVEAAQHIFGFGLDRKTSALHRLGWLTTSTQEEEAMVRLSQVLFEPVHQVYELQNQRPRRNAGRKSIGNDRSLVNADGAKGDAGDSSPIGSGDDEAEAN